MTTFINKGQRPELFELTDNEVAVFRVTISDDEFIQLKQKTNVGNKINNRYKLTEQMYLQANGFVQFLSHFNFKQTYPGKNFTEVLPELNINEEGFAQIDPTEVLNRLNITKEGILGIDLTSNENFQNIYEIIDNTIYSRPEFNLTKIMRTMDRLGHDDNDQEEGNIKQQQQNFNSNSEEVFKTKQATLNVELNGNQEDFETVTFSIGGYSSHSYGKQGFNFKIHGNKVLYGRKQFRLRSDAREATFLRSKLVCDIQNRLGIPSISANYATLYINDEYMGLYVLMDIYRPSWIKYEYGEKDTKTLYQCKSTGNFLTVEKSINSCINRNDEVKDHSEWVKFITSLNKAQTVEEIESIFDVDLFLTQIALEFLFGSWDHFLNYGHNYYLYKPVNDKWKYLSYDFDAEFGQDLDLPFFRFIYEDMPELMINFNTDYPKYSFGKWTKKNHLIEILILNNPGRFNKILKNIVTEVFNPTTLFSHIDELKEFIRPYVELDKIPDNNGKYPGRLNEKLDDYTLEQWEANSEFTTIQTTTGFKAYGIKYWILEKYRFICKTYYMDCDPIYIDENYEYPINKNVEYLSYFPSLDPSTTTTTTIRRITTSTTTTTTTTTTTSFITPTKIATTYNCLAELLGYSCCSPENTNIYLQDENGDWGFDFEKNEWCGLTPYIETCWSEEIGYPCCKTCDVFYEEDYEGRWGIENDNWCGIPTSCSYN
ncbi:hypothetical protein BCR32DRAFT_228678 [Anaeromyces robustus]|uniref:CBM10 domain-containing protein n=1 Tax=Anaeromyces robustus TaxID=1754192 RepID=A0A1Y1XN61_9FUNG|nr:hypothetical protein BCR32DRAFT_228678 [Anaeromyces robustus]|eukprot:ORX86784.1 hypothetical protein BCR32DRAFT_228678 [Anaeromyces robustus]